MCPGEVVARPLMQQFSEKYLLLTWDGCHQAAILTVSQMFSILTTQPWGHGHDEICFCLYDTFVVTGLCRCTRVERLNKTGESTGMLKQFHN